MRHSRISLRIVCEKTGFQIRWAAGASRACPSPLGLAHAGESFCRSGHSAQAKKPWQQRRQRRQRPNQPTVSNKEKDDKEEKENDEEEDKEDEEEEDDDNDDDNDDEYDDDLDFPMMVKTFSLVMMMLRCVMTMHEIIKRSWKLFQRQEWAWRLSFMFEKGKIVLIIQIEANFWHVIL